MSQGHGEEQVLEGGAVRGGDTGSRLGTFRPDSAVEGAVIRSCTLRFGGVQLSFKILAILSKKALFCCCYCHQ